ncbi:MAG: uL30 family ribosomal protein [archaeon]
MTIVVIRIAGQVGLRRDIAETLYRLKIRRKLACVLVDEKDPVMMGMVLSVKEYVTYGPVDAALIKELNEKRGVDKEKGFYRLHPPIGGFKKSVKLAATEKGILGINKDIDKLLRRML